MTMAFFLGESMENFELLISEAEIRKRIAEVARVIEQDYKGEEITVVMVMKGAICIAADLMRELSLPLVIEYVSASSYGMRGIERGELAVEGLDKIHISSKNVLLVDDIYDSGATLMHLISTCKMKNPKTLKTLVLLSKKIKRDLSYIPDYVLFEIENQFVVGFGLDYNERYRGLRGIYIYV